MKKLSTAIMLTLAVILLTAIFAGCDRAQPIPEAQLETADFTVKNVSDTVITTGTENTIEILLSITLKDGVEKLDNVDFKLILDNTEVAIDIYYAYRADDTFVKAENATPVAEKNLYLKIKNKENFKTNDGIFLRVLRYRDVCIASGKNVTVKV